MIEFRLALKSDCNILFEWINDPLVRDNSFISKEIQYDEHKNWFYNKLVSINSRILVVLKKSNEIGMIRIDKIENIGVINYLVSSEYRGNGYGEEILKKVVSEAKKLFADLERLTGKVKKSNIPSIKAFERADYKRIISDKNSDEYIEFYKLI